MAIRVRVRMVGSLGRIAAEQEVVLELEEGATLGQLVRRLRERYGAAVSDWFTGPEEDAISPRIRVLVNGQFSFVLDGADTVLEEGDVVSLMPVISGG